MGSSIQLVGRRDLAQTHEHEITLYVSLLRDCTKKKDLRVGAKLHDALLKEGLLRNCSDALVSMYAKCGVLSKAKELFDMHKSRDVFTWTALMAGYTQKGHGREAIDHFERMQQEGISPDAVTFISILKACGLVRALDKGEDIHDQVAKSGLLRSDIVLGTALVDMYAKCGALAKAWRVLQELPSRNTITWTALIAGYTEHGDAAQALHSYEEMQREGLSPNEFTFSCALKACGSIRAADKGERIHNEIAKQGMLGSNVVLGTALVDMYAKCGALAKARRVLDELSMRNVISWNALMTGYAEHNEGAQGLDCFELMQREGLSPDAVTFACALKACSSIGAAAKGEEIHDEIAKQGLLRNDIVLGNALVDMYAKCGSLAKALLVLDELPIQDVVSWNALIAGFAQQCEGGQALDCFERMQCKGLSPNASTFTSVLKACGGMGAADKGEEIHHEVAEQGLLHHNMVLGNALLDMYARCGALAKAQQVLDELPVRNVTSWTALIAGYAEYGESDEALRCFEEMQHEGVSPNTVTLACVLNACGRLGLVQDGQSYFGNMSTKYDTEPDLEHYASMVDLLGRAGYLDRAAGIIKEMPQSSVGWCALLSACRKWGDVDVGRWAFERAVQADKNYATTYVLMADIYAAAGMQNDPENSEAMRMEMKAWTTYSKDVG